MLLEGVHFYTYDNFTLYSMFRPKAFMKKKHALQYHFRIKAFDRNTELRVKLSYVLNIKMAFHCRADDGPTLNAGLVAL